MGRNTWDLNFWKTGEWQVCEEELKRIKNYNPGSKNIFRALEVVSPDEVRVAIFGQDPYPQSKFCTGLAFSIPPEETTIPPTLRTIFDEYESDLGYPRPLSGDLSLWVKQGVLLWNVIPSTTEGHSLSHDWDEWQYLNTEIINKLVEHDCVFVFLGSVARRYAKYVPPWLPVIQTSHPSPRGSLSAKEPFKGSKIFTRINDSLVSLSKGPINWKLT